MSSTREKIEVMEAFERGKTIQSRSTPSDSWEHNVFPAWDWMHMRYRVEPKPAEVWCNDYQYGWGCPHPSKEHAISAAYDNAKRTAVRFIEAPEDA